MPWLTKEQSGVSRRTCVCGHKTCVCVDVCVLCVLYMRAPQHASMRVHGCGFMTVWCRVRVLCAVQKRLKVMHACILQHSAPLFIQVTHTHDPSWFPMGCHTHTWQSSWAWGMLARGQQNSLPMLVRGAEPLLAEHGQLMQGGWSPTQRIGMLICWHCVPRSTPRFLIRQLEIDLDGNVSLSI